MVQNDVASENSLSDATEEPANVYTAEDYQQFSSAYPEEATDMTSSSSFFKTATSVKTTGTSALMSYDVT
jgi:hypothetical protein